MPGRLLYRASFFVTTAANTLTPHLSNPQSFKITPGGADKVMYEIFYFLGVRYLLRER